jgi:hypothetical protein
MDFTQYTFPEYRANWHHELLCSYLDRFIKGSIPNLMVFMPPQHGKSELVSRRTPAKILGDYPDDKVVIASYSDTMAAGFNRDVQRIMETQEYTDTYPGTMIASTEREYSGSWMKNSSLLEVVGRRGSLRTVGVGGSLTGNPADWAFIDDPVKDAIEASSPTTQENIWSWYNDVFLTRCNNRTRKLITQTRWDENDLSGKLLKVMENSDRLDDQWEILCLPAIREDYTNPFDPRELGDALWPEEHSLAKIEAVRARSARTFFALYQQNPKPVQAGGEFYKGFDMARHVKHVEYDPALPLIVSFDENVVPYQPALIGQIHGKTYRAIREITMRTPNNTIKAACDSITATYPDHTTGMFINGDATSQKEDVKLEKGYDFFRLIIQYLARYRPQRRVGKSNPSVAMRGSWLNDVFSNGTGGIGIEIDPKCIELIADLNFVKEGPDKGKVKQEGIDPHSKKRCQLRGHLSDCLDYTMTENFQGDYLLYQKGGARFNISYGHNESKHSY